MEITVSRYKKGFIAVASSQHGVVFSTAVASTWYESWLRLARVLSLLRVKYSLKFNF